MGLQHRCKEGTIVLLTKDGMSISILVKTIWSNAVTLDVAAPSGVKITFPVERDYTPHQELFR